MLLEEWTSLYSCSLSTINSLHDFYSLHVILTEHNGKKCKKNRELDEHVILWLRALAI